VERICWNCLGLATEGVSNTTNMKEIWDLLDGIDTAALCDSNKALRCIDPGIKCITNKSRCVGRARVVQCDQDFLAVLQELAEAGTGDVLVIAGDGQQKAFAGELFVNEARRRGLAGIVIDGGCRDTGVVKEMEFPLFARWVTPMAGTALKPQSDIAVSRALVGGVEVRSGDIIMADMDGIVVMSDLELQEVLPMARNIQDVERQVLEKVRNGTSLLNLVNLESHVEALKHGTPSRLQFLL
jgi:4-hydroxy-4-methyl-2-oxoglutarate aldolase